VDSLSVRWPNGTVQVVYPPSLTANGLTASGSMAGGLAVDQAITVVEPPPPPLVHAVGAWGLMLVTTILLTTTTLALRSR
jgi:hypothetical protein